MSKTGYRFYIEQTARHHLAESRKIIDDWKNNIEESNLFGYSPTNYPASLAVVLGYLYQETGDENYVSTAVNLLLEYEEIKKIYPKKFYEKRIEFKNGLPPIADFFDMNSYAMAYRYIRSSQKIDPAQRTTIESGVADCANFLFNFPEWGAMNRAMLRAQVYLYSALALPDHPDAAKWRQMAKVLASDSYQRWEGEDAAGYHPVWLLSLFHYVDATQDDDFYRSAIPRYYLDYFAYQITPLTILPDYGDAWWPSPMGRWIAIFEKGAAVYQEPLFKWAAQQFWEYQKQTAPEQTDLGLARNLIDAVEWSDETIPAKPLAGKSRLVMEEVVGKKVVFRNGVDVNSTYLMLNYRDEGDGAFLFREFMRTSITAEQEKPHHGHADENSIVTLINRGDVLLHDAGYRTHLPSGDYGNYRADYFHNRLVVRKNRRWVRHEGTPKEQPVWEFLRNAGVYRPVQTKLVDFIAFDKIEFSRSRVTDIEMGYEWDRSVIYHKTDDFFVIVDGVRALRRDIFTFTNLWHTQNILAQGDRWFNTRIDNINDYQNKGNRELLVHFPIAEFDRSVGAFDLQRHDQPEKAIYETISSFYYENQMEVFVTVLFPHAPKVSADSIVKKFQIIKSDKFPQSIGLKMNFDDREEYISVKLNLIMDYSAQTRTPRYEYEHGQVKYGPVETDGNFAFISKNGKQIYWAASLMTHLKFEDKILQESRLMSHGIQPAPTPEVIWRPAKWRYWEQTDDI